MINTASTYLRRTVPPLRTIVLLGVALSQIPLAYVPDWARFVVLWLVALGISALCASIVPIQRRRLVGLSSLVSILSVLSINVRQLALWLGGIGGLWFLIIPVLGVALLQVYLILISRAVPLADTSLFTATDSRANLSVASRRRSFLATLITLHALSLGLYWAYSDHVCSWFDLTRRVQGCALVQTLTAFPANTNEVQIAPSGALAASAAPVTDTESLLLASPFTTETFEALQQRLKTEANTISLWDLKAGQLLRTLDQPTRPFEIKFSPNDQLVATRSADEQVRVWRVNDGSLLHTFPGARAMVFSDDGSLLAAANGDNHIDLWLPQNGTLLRTIAAKHETGLAVEMVFSPDGEFLAVRESAEVKLWRVSDGTLHQTLPTYQLAGYLNPSLSFSPDSQTLATTGRSFGKDADGSVVRLWRVADGTPLHTLQLDQVLTEEPRPTDIRAAAFSADSTRLVVGVAQWPYADRALIWRVADGALLEHRRVATIDMLRFSDDGTALQLYDVGLSDDVRIYTQRIAQAATQ